MPSSIKLIIAPVIALLVGYFLWSSRLTIFDDIRLFHYKPPAQIASFATQDTMTPYARKLFYVYHPALESSSAFNSNCKVSQAAIVLGCTVIGQGIYIYNVTTPDLNGVDQVTAAYEMLHVAYSRLSSSERNKIDALIQTTYDSIAPTDPTIRAEVASYYQTEGASAVPNELHSVLGTEVASLPPTLEQYYAKYFTNRSAIVAMENSYQSAFTQRQAAVSADDSQLSAWQQQITSDEQSLTAQDQQINQMQAQLNSEKSSGNISAYNSGVPAYNALVNSYNALADTTKSLIASYNALVSARNSVAVSEDNLIQSISSLPSSINTR